MAVVLSVLPHAGGNLAPTLIVAAELRRRGHTVSFLGHEQLRSAIEAEGFEFEPFTHARPWSATVAEPGVRSMLGWLTLASDRGIGRDLSERVARTPADIILLDCMIPGALSAARHSGVPVVLMLHAFFSYWSHQWSVRSPMGLWLWATRTRPFGRTRAPDLGIVASLPELDPVPQSWPFPLVQAGPLVEKPKALVELEQDAPILVSLSTVSYPGQDDTLRRIVQAIGDLPVRAIVTNAVGLQGIDIPPNVELRAFVPHREVLPHVRLVIGHGGHGTTMTALAHGIPVLVLPMSSHADQPLVGEAIDQAGAGAAVSKHATADELREVIRSVLDDPGAREGAARLGALIRNSRAAESAADAIEATLLTTR